MKRQSYTLERVPEKGYANKGFESDDPKSLDEYLVEVPNVTDDAKDDSAKNGSDETQRDTFDNPIEFLLSIISMSVGVGNFYRFPFTAYENGGGAFLIPYLVVLFLIGKPIYFMELTLGQFSSFGQVKCWKMSPFFKGVGYGSTLGSFCVVSYYCSIMSLTVFYFFASFQATLPWTNCKESWAGPEVCSENYTWIDVNGTVSNKSSLAQLYFENEVLKQYDNIDDGIGYPEWRLTLCLLFSWIAVFFSLVKGVKSSGKVAYFTAIYPYIVLLILLIQGLTKEGSTDGILYFLTPQWERIFEPKVWFAAISQCFFSLSTGFGPIIMYASYNPFRHNVYRDAMIVSVMDTFTSLLAGLTVFAILGNLASDLGVDISAVAKSGPSLIFSTYADAISKFEWVPQLFAVLFFLMLFSLGVGSAVSWQMAVITVICDQFPQWSRFYVTLITCIAGFLVGLIYCTPGGQFLLTLVDSFGGNFTIYVLATLEVVGIVWVYGLFNYCKDVEFMLKMRISWFWKFCWGFFVPVVLIGVLIYFLIEYETIQHNNVEFPTSAIVSGWILSAFCLIFVPICALHSILTRKADTFYEKLKLSFLPTKDWGPQNATLKAEWIEYKRKA